MTGLRLERQEKKVQEAARLVKGEIRGPMEALRACEVCRADSEMRQGVSSGTLRMPVAEHGRT